MKTLAKYSAMAVLASAVIGTAMAGGWSHAQYSPGSWSGSVTTPSATHVEQYAGNSFDVVINDGPAGNYTLYQGQTLDADADVPAGTYSFYQSIGPKGGYSCAVVTW